MRIADTDADQEARVDPVVDAGGGAGEVVGQRGSVAVAQHAAQPTQRTGLQALNGPVPSQSAVSQACASALALTGARSTTRVPDICWPKAFMNIMALLVFMVPNSAQGWPLILSSAGRPCCGLRLASTVKTLPTSSFDAPLAAIASSDVRRTLNLVAGLAGGAGEGRPHRQEDIVRVVYEKRCHEGEGSRGWRCRRRSWHPSRCRYGRPWP